MKKNIFILLMIISSFLYSKNIFTYKDIKGDDNGYGTYTYPKNKIFQKGDFDIISISIEEDEKDYIFKIEIANNFENELTWQIKGSNGWDVQMFDFYLNFGKSKNHQTIAGRNLYIEEGWDKAILISPAPNKLMLEREILPKNFEIADDITKAENLIKDIILPSKYKVEDNIIMVMIKKEELKDMKNLKMLQCFASGAEGFPSQFNTYIRDVNEYNSEWRFGGGTDYDGDTNVIDILGDNKKMGKYVSSIERVEFAKINMIKVK